MNGYDYNCPGGNGMLCDGDKLCDYGRLRGDDLPVGDEFHDDHRRYDDGARPVMM
jgi:hypothetical protein